MSAPSTSREIRLAEQLAKACIASQDICAVHHMVFCGLFGSRLHEPMAIAKGLSSNPSILVYIKKWRPEEVVGRETNRQSKWEWSRCNDNDFLRFVGLMVDDLVRNHPQTGTYSNAMKWCLEAYLAIILPSSPVKMKKIKYEPISNVETTNSDRKQYHFCIVAKDSIPSGVYIHHLIGLMATDANTPHTGISQIRPHLDNLGPKEPRILIGPARLINHCGDIEGSKSRPNVAWSAISGTHAICVYTLRAIQEGEELLIQKYK